MSKDLHNEPFISSAERAKLARESAVRVIRLSFIILILTVTVTYIFVTTTDQATGMRSFGLRKGWEVPVGAALLVAMGMLALDILTPRKRLGIIGAAFFGILAGLVASFLVNLILDLFLRVYEAKGESDIFEAVKIVVGIGLCFLGVTIVLQTQDEFRLAIPYVEFTRQVRGTKPLILDSSALIDARVVDLAGCGIIQAPIIVPKYVIGELQTLADSQDKLKRAKGRRGLDSVTKLQRVARVDVKIDDTEFDLSGVDSMLVEHARSLGGVVVTADIALNRIASIKSVSVLNINEVANALKPSLIPGSQLILDIIRRGEQPSQGVGYLEDGTMVVVTNGQEAVGRAIRVEVTGAMQTAGGRLIFGTNAEHDDGPASDAKQSIIEDNEVAQLSTDGDAGHNGSESLASGDVDGPKDRDLPEKSGPLGPGQSRKTPHRNPRRT